MYYYYLSVALYNNIICRCSQSPLFHTGRPPHFRLLPLLFFVRDMFPWFFTYIYIYIYWVLTKKVAKKILPYNHTHHHHQKGTNEIISFESEQGAAGDFQGTRVKVCCWQGHPYPL